jgi:Glycosyl hydrolases family 38 N-terminal domain
MKVAFATDIEKVVFLCSLDPFGHGSTVPYLLATSGFEGTIIQRIHYSWKQVSGFNRKKTTEKHARAV